MKILIEDAATLEYYTRDGRWSRNKKDAVTFASSALAKASGKNAPIGRFNIVGFFSDSPQLTNLDEGCGTKTAS